MKKKRYIFISRKGNRPQPIDYSKEYFFIEDVSGERNLLIIMQPTSGSTYVNVSVSTDKVNWIDLGSTESGDLYYTIPANGKLYVKGVNDNWGTFTGVQDNNRISCTKHSNIGGNIMSLLYGDEYIDKDVLQVNYVFSCLFYGSDIVDASNLVLPATTLSRYCYYGMFYNCTSLTTAPTLPATELAQSCYQSMFYNCKSLTTAPVLPATELAGECYSSMFSGCTSLTTAQVLPATTLTSYCYTSMFRGCSSLTTAPVLPATTLEFQCYNSMFSGCSSLTTAPVLSATNLASYCYDNMFEGCTSLTTAPELPAETLVAGCYYGMFKDCTSLTEAPELPATTLANECCARMFQGCTSLTQAPSVLPATTLANNCYKNMFSGCSSLTTAPALLARTLTYACYFEMFRDCTSLNKVTTLANNISATACLSDWLYNVSPTGDFYNLGTATYPSGGSGIPEGWTNTYPQFVDVTAVPSAFSLKSYQRYIQCNYTLIKTLEGGIQVTEQGSHTVETGKNTGDEPRAIVETVHENPLATITIIQTANDPEPPTTYIVLKPDDVTYGFENHGSGYYESTNQGINNSYSYAIVHYKGFETLRLSCINYAESNYDYGMISKEDVMLNKGYNSESDTNLTKSFKGLQSPDPVIVTIPSDGGEHFITIKYIKDSSDHKNYDSLQFKVLED